MARVFRLYLLGAMSLLGLGIVRSHDFKVLNSASKSYLNGDYVLSWVVSEQESADGEGTDGHLTLTIKAKTLGWVGFGIGDMGGMLGADLVHAHVDDSTGSLSVVDHYSLTRDGFPLDDECQSWEAVEGTQDEGEGTTTVTIRRMLDTRDGEKEDRPIVNDGRGTKILIAFGAGGDALSNHGPNNRQTDELNFFEYAGDGVRKLEVGDEENVLLKSILNSYVMTEKDTHYESLCFDYADFNFGDDVEKVFITEFRPFIESASARYVHHFIANKGEGDCGGTERFDQGVQIFVWAPGAGNKYWPPGFSEPFSPGEYITLETHYDNPTGFQAVGVRDASGVSFVYQLSDDRDGRLTTLSIGDPLPSGDLIGQGVKSWKYECSSACFQDEQRAPIAHVSLHGHNAATFLELRQMRGGEEVKRWTNRYYDFGFQGGQHMPNNEKWELVPGDEFTMECIYDSADPKLVFGQGSWDEMCIAFVTVMGNFTTRSCVSILEKLDDEFAVIKGFADCNSPKSFPFTQNNFPQELCQFLNFIDDSDDCLKDVPSYVTPSFLYNYLDCAQKASDPTDGWSVTAPVDESRIPYCTQQKPVVVKSLTPSSLKAIKVFGGGGVGTCPNIVPIEDGKESDVLEGGAERGARGVGAVLAALVAWGVVVICGCL